MADLTAPSFTVTPNGVEVESKEDVCDRLGRSTDRGDAVVMAWFEGPKLLTHALEWMDLQPSRHGMSVAPKIVTSGRQPLSVRARDART